MYHQQGDATRASAFERRARQRENAIRRLMWDQQNGVFIDYLWKEQRQTRIVSAATVDPRYFRIGTPGQAKTVASTISRELEASGVLLEKYNVETVNSERGGGGGGEYPLQVGLGWTNGVLATLMSMYPRQNSDALRQHPAPAGK